MKKNNNKCESICAKISGLTFKAFEPIEIDNDKDYIDIFEEIRNVILKTAVLKEGDATYRFPVLKPAIEKVKELKDILEKISKFYIIDYYFPDEEKTDEKKASFGALFVLSDDSEKDEYMIYRERLNQLYDQKKIESCILDTNKIIALTASYSPVIICDGKIVEGDKRYDQKELYYDVSVINNDEVNIRKCDIFADKINEFYDYYKKHEDKIVLDNHVSNQIVDKLDKKQELNGVTFENTKAALLTYAHFLKEILPFNNISEYIYFPAISEKYKNNRVHSQWIGGILFSFTKETTLAERNAIRGLTQKVISSIYQQYQLLKIKSNEQQIIRHARKAAISQVMARNASHNIGSHVLNKIINGVEDINWKEACYRSLINDDLSNEIREFSGSKVEIKDSKKSISLSEAINIIKNKDNIIKQLTEFNKYVKCRMDYLSDMALGIPVMQTSKSMSDIMKGIDNVRLLLENISGLSGYDYTIELRFDSNVMMAMPNDLLGCQALYNVIENIIRNTAKHGNKGIDEVVFTVAVEDYNNDLYKLCIYDNLPYLEDEIDELVEGQNGKIMMTILGKDYKLRHESLGMAEMKASASYLRKIDLSEIDLKLHEPKLLKAEKHCMGNYNYSLKYELFLLKPKEVLFVMSDDPLTLNDEQINAGFEVISNEVFKSKLDDNITVSHRYLVYDDAAVKGIINDEKYKGLLPIRCYQSEKIDKMIGENVDEMKNNICSKWLKEKNISVKGVVNGLSREEDKIGFDNHIKTAEKQKEINNLLLTVWRGYWETFNSLGMSYLPYFNELKNADMNDEFLNEKSVVSNYKSNKFNWLQVSLL